MKRPVAGYWSRIELSQEQKDRIRAVVKAASWTDALIDGISAAIAPYPDLARDWSGPTPKQLRDAIRKLHAVASEVVDQLKSLDEVGQQCIMEAQVAAGTYGRPNLETLLDELTHFSDACRRAAESPDLNRGQGNIADDARDYLIRCVAAAYRMATGTSPSPSSGSTFAKVLKVALEAAGADPGISHDHLKRLLPSSGKSSRRR